MLYRAGWLQFPPLIAGISLLLMQDRKYQPASASTVVIYVHECKGIGGGNVGL